MTTRTVTAPARPLDAIYDRDYVLSSEASHQRAISQALQKTGAAAGNVAAASAAMASTQANLLPSAQNMFSALPHYPAATLRAQSQLEQQPLRHAIPTAPLAARSVTHSAARKANRPTNIRSRPATL